MKKRIEIKPIMIAVALILFQSFCYLISKLLEGQPHLIGNIIDQKIPFNIYAIIPYCIWYVLLFLIPYLLYKRDKTKLAKYCLSYVIVTLIANIIFIIYPTTVIRPEITGTSLIELITRFIYWIDTPILNCFPSLHCAMSMLWILYIFNLKDTNIYEKIIVMIISISIMLSTLFIKQHVFIDLLCGDIIAVSVYAILLFEKKYTERFKKLFYI